VDVGYERFLAPEIFFNPEIYSSDFLTPLPEIVDSTIQSSPIDVRRGLYKVRPHVSLSPHLIHTNDLVAEHCFVRWIDDVSAFRPAAEARSETTRKPSDRGERNLEWGHAEGWYKSNVRVSVLITSPQSSGVEVDVISHKRQRYAVWFGGSLLASLVSEYWVTMNIGTDAGDSLSFTLLATPKHSTMRLGRALYGATRSSAARLRFLHH
jgi:actin-related protein 3